MKNLAKHNRRALLRYRKQRCSPYNQSPILWRRLPTGAFYRLTQGNPLRPNWHYWPRTAHVYAPYPPDARTQREIQRWS